MTNDINTPISDFFDILKSFKERRFRNRFKDHLNSESAPFNVGKIRMSVRIFENKPIRGRNRQMHEFFFNKTTLGNINRKTLIDLEPVFSSDNPDSSGGVTLKKTNYMYHTFLARFKSESSVSSSSGMMSLPESDSENFGSFDSAYIQSVPASEIEDIPSEDSMDFNYNLYGFYSKNRAEQYNSCFYPVGSIYSNESMGEKFERFVSPTIDNEGNYSPSAVATLEQFFKGLDPDIVQVGFAPVQQQFGSQGISYISVNCAYPGNFYKTIELDDSISNFLNKFFTLTLYPPGSLFFGDGQDAYVNITPGKHISFKKLTPIFPGEDFSISFRKTSHDESVTVVQPQSGSSVAYRLMGDLECIDIHANDGTNHRNLIKIPPNYGVAEFLPDEEAVGGFKFTNKGVDFSSDPYVMVEIYGGVNNWFFLMISHGKTVKLFEVHDQPEVINVHEQTELSGGGQVKERRVVPSSEKGHSSLLYEFDFTGDRLLKEDRFKVSFQHMRGALQISFDVVDKTYIVSRERLSNKFLASIEDYQENGGGVATVDIKDFDKIEWQFAPIKLRGFVWISMGNYSTSFNFSPIKYIPAKFIKPDIPIPVLGFFNARSQSGSGGSSKSSVGENVTSMLLRSLGTPYDVEEEHPESSPSDDGGSPIDGMEPLYYKQQAQKFYEIVNGDLFTYESSKLPESQRQLIPGEFSDDKRSINYFDKKLGSSYQPSRLTCEKTPNRSAEGSGDQYAFQYNPTVGLIAGSVVFYRNN